MKEMSRDMQVIGSALAADRVEEGRITWYTKKSWTIAWLRVSRCFPNRQVEELARMLSGAEVTSEAIENAVMLQG